MKNKVLLIFSVVCLGFIATFGVVAPSLAVDIPGKEAPLNPSGQVHELYRDSQGNLWISDFFTGEIWRVNPLTNSYIAYDGLDGASSGMTDSQGNLWWADFDGGAVGRMVPGQATATVWDLPAGSMPLGLTIDGSGRIWATDPFKPDLYRLDRAGNQLCRYMLPNGGGADYIFWNNSRLWIGDTVQGRLIRLDPASGAFTSWKLAAGAYPQGIAVDGSGQVWWADNALGTLGRLNPTNNQATVFDIPGNGNKPQMVAYEEGAIWYSDLSGWIGAMDPQKAQGNATSLSVTSATVQPTCGALGQGRSIPVTTRSGAMTWQQTGYNIVQDSGGWRIYGLPAGSKPWGLAVSEGNAWFADQGNGTQRAQYLGFVNAGEPEPVGQNSYIPTIMR